MNAHARDFTQAATTQVDRATASSQAVGENIASLLDSNLAFTRQSVEETARFMRDFASNRSMSDAIKLQADFVRGRSTALVDQCEKVAGVYFKMAEEAMQPMRSAAASVGIGN